MRLDVLRQEARRVERLGVGPEPRVVVDRVDRDQDRRAAPGSGGRRSRRPRSQCAGRPTPAENIRIASWTHAAVHGKRATSSNVGRRSPEHRVDLLEHPLARVGVQRQQVPHPRERVGGRLVAREDERRRLVADPAERQRLARPRRGPTAAARAGRRRRSGASGARGPPPRRSRRLSRMTACRRPIGGGSSGAWWTNDAHARNSHHGGLASMISRVARSAARSPSVTSGPIRRARSAIPRPNSAEPTTSSVSSVIPAVMSSSIRSEPSSSRSTNASIGSIIRSHSPSGGAWRAPD